MKEKIYSDKKVCLEFDWHIFLKNELDLEMIFKSKNIKLNLKKELTETNDHELILQDFLIENSKKISFLLNKNIEIENDEENVVIENKKEKKDILDLSDEEDEIPQLEEHST